MGVSTLRVGSHVLDAGIDFPNSMEAGRLLAEACMGAMGRVKLVQLFGDFWLPGVQVTVQFPAVACLGFQYAGWPVNIDYFSALGSGPTRAVAAKEEVFEAINYREKATCRVLVLETGKMPSNRVVKEVTFNCNFSSENIWLLVAPTASLVGSVQVVARIVDTGLHKLLELGYDVNRVTSALVPARWLR